MNSYQNSPGDSRDMQKHSLSSPSPSATTVEAAPPTSSSSYGVIANHYVLGVAFYSFLGFTLLQTAFALRARSSAMIADSIAMYVDAFTYLCNLLAERLKDRKSMTEYERQLTPLVLKYRRKMQSLYLELIPPMISVTILLIATIVTLKDSIHTLLTPDKIAVDPNLKIMMVFSVLNLFVDCLNVAFFARTDNGLQLSKSSLNLLDNERRGDRYTSSSKTNNEFHISEDTETSHLVTKSFQESFVNDTFESTAHYANDIFLDDNDNTNEVNQRNLNMCSAFTHVFADTLRSVAVLLAAAIASFTSGIVSPDVADAAAALFVSLIILFSCFPLIHGLIITVKDILELKKRSPLS